MKEKKVERKGERAERETGEGGKEKYSEIIKDK